MSSAPAFGHLLPLLPLARAFHTQGHTVAILTAAGMAPSVEAEGFELLPAGPMPDVLLAEVARRTGVHLPAGPTPEAVAEFFAGARVDLSADGALEEARRWEPDLIVNETTDFVGPLVATALGVPLATLAYGPETPSEFTDPMVAMVRSRYDERGLPAPDRMPAGRWLLDTCPPGLQFDGVGAPPAVERIPLRPEPHQAPGAPDTAAPGPVYPVAERPRVLVSFGTVFGDPVVVGRLLRSLTALDVDLVATLGLDGKPEDYDLDPDRVELTPFAPLAQLLENVAAIVCHGGAGTTLGALARGIPMVVVPQGADQFVQADRVVAAGAGLAIPPDQNEPEVVAAALRRVLTEPGFAAAARRIADQVAAMPSPDDVAARLRTALTT